jgi:septation ring formation regulator EzrA
MTGKYIYETIRKLKEEMMEIGKACDMVADEIGQGTIAWNLLDTQYKEKQKEIRKIENTEFTC